MAWITPIAILLLCVIIIPTIELFYYKRKFDNEILSISKNYWKAMDKLNSSKTIEQFDSYKKVILTWMGSKIDGSDKWSTGQIVLYDRIVGNKCGEYYKELSKYKFVSKPNDKT